MPADERFQMAVEAPHAWARVIRFAGILDRGAAASILRMVDAQLELHAARHCRLTDLVLDLEHVRSFERGGLEAIRHARHSTARRSIRLHLVGCSARLHLLPLRACQLLGEFSTFPTLEIALAELARTSPSPARSPAATPPSVPEPRRSPERMPGWPASPETRAGDEVPPSR
jgi:anti-anti-sigma regulatory factor